MKENFCKNFKPLKIGDLQIQNPVVLAPMAGVSDFSFRKIVRKFSPSELMVSEMVSSNSQNYFNGNKGVVKNPKLAKMYERVQNFEKPLSIQIFGGDVDLLAASAKINQDRGADIIDINMGCPVKKIVKSCAGSDLLRYPDRIKEIVKAVVNAVDIPVSVKIRLGWDDSSKNAVEIAKIVQEQGAKMLTVHGRTRAQLYRGSADWEAIAQVVQAVDIPVIANGDIVSFEDAEKCLNVTKAAGIMIGRGCYGKPWFIKDVVEYLKTGEKPLDLTDVEKNEIVLEHFNFMLKEYGDMQGVLNFRKHASWYSKGIKNGAEFRGLINKAKTYEEVISLIKEFF